MARHGTVCDGDWTCTERTQAPIQLNEMRRFIVVLVFSHRRAKLSHYGRDRRENSLRVVQSVPHKHTSRRFPPQNQQWCRFNSADTCTPSVRRTRASCVCVFVTAFASEQRDGHCFMFAWYKWTGWRSFLCPRHSQSVSIIHSDPTHCFFTFSIESKPLRYAHIAER